MPFCSLPDERSELPGLARGDELSAKDYLKASNKLTSDEQECLNRFHQYTLEATILTDVALPGSENTTARPRK
ncbi:hypothetical protein H5410_051176 [Solanum commersonii]|uniref:Uncharacterized protein n=1 Tax=Solanum commersonii TaxID=4109 RepID=A0A9J5WZ88_SOLCO|nr:hypothetical protein H5410_051176 [Solanum commersonii]